MTTPTEWAKSYTKLYDAMGYLASQTPEHRVKGLEEAKKAIEEMERQLSKEDQHA